MTLESPSPESESPSPAPEASSETQVSPVSPRPSQLPAWLPFFLVAVVPAVVVGLLVYAFAANDSTGGGGSAAAIIDGFIRLGSSSEGNVTTVKGQLPSNFPREFPRYAGAKPVVSFVIPSNEGTNYLVIFRTSDPTDKVYHFYVDRMDKDAWQIEYASASDNVTGLRFNRPDNPDIQGVVTLRRSEVDNQTTILVSIDDLGKKSQGSSSDKPFVLGESRALPPGFPNDIPVYKGRNNADSVITETSFERGQGGRSFTVSFLTKDSQDDVLGYYRQEFEKRGWQVTNSPSTQNRGFRLSIDFSDTKTQQVQGTVRADAFDEDPSYTKVDLLLQISGSRGRGN